MAYQPAGGGVGTRGVGTRACVETAVCFVDHATELRLAQEKIAEFQTLCGALKTEVS